MSDTSLSENDAARPRVQMLEVGEHQQDQRLDNFLTTRLKGVPKSLLYRIIRKGEVRVNGKRARPEHKLQAGDQVRVPPVRQSGAKAAARPGSGLQELLRASVLYEDAELMVLNKPAGLAVHAGTGVRLGLIEALRAMYPQLPGLELVHRLDKGTSGCLLLAKTGKARRTLMNAFRDQQVRKVYHALVAGNWPAGLDLVDASLSRGPARGGERKVSVAADGKAASTGFKVLRQFREAALLEARPLTGRTHQIRVHAAQAGCPLLGDDKYDNAAGKALCGRHAIKRLCLHAAELSFRHPDDGRLLTFRAGYDEAFRQAVAMLAAAD